MVDPDRAEVIVYTIGHSNHPLEYCVDLLRRWEIEIVADVRTQPYSRWVPHFSREALRSALAGRGIGYWYLGQALGGKRDAGYSEIALRADFQAAIDELAGSAQRTRITVMCAEEDPRRCHRHLLLSPALRRLGAGVRHIRGDGSLERDEDLTPPSLFPRSGALILSPR